MRKNPGSKKPSFKLKPMCAAVLLAFSVNASANPNGGTVVNGSASFNTNGNTLTVTNTPGTIINWQDFSINSNEITHFAQQSASSAVLNRVITSNPSVILGTLSSNGRVFLVNPGGIVFGAGSTVDVAGMVATSLNLSDADFLAGRGNFTLTPGAQAVSNAGNITAQSGGEIYLIAPNVENSGVITAPNGEILLAAGHEVQLVNTLDPNLRVNITAPAGDATNIGQLVSSAGRLGLFGTVVKNTGAVSADSATMQGGKIVFKASQRVELGGTVSTNGVSGGSVNVVAAHSTDATTPGVVVQTGTVDAQGAGGAGGAVQVNADNILSTAAINVNGATAGGQIGVVATGDVVTTSGAIYSANGGTASGGDILVAAGANSYSSGSYLAQGATGGNIAMTASNLTLSAATLDASGVNGGGGIHVGGVLHGAAGFSAQGIALNNAGNLTVTGTTKLIADALQNGNGGEIVLWSDGTTLSGGAISAHGGALSGNGGFVEVSGKQTLGYAGALDVSAPNGASGTLLLDPANIVIDSAAPQGGALSGVVSATLVDPHPVAGNKFGSYTYVLTNGNVVVAVPSDSLVNSAAGAVYLFDGTTGALISTLTGSSVSDQVGLGGVTALTNGNFVVNSWLWHSWDLGAITWGSGTTGVNGAVSAANSLVGVYLYDSIGAPTAVTGWDARANINATIGHGGVIALTNGNYVVSSPWAYSNGGMVTWGNGLGGTVGSVSAANSLVGTTVGDFIGTNVVALSNGNYVVGSSNFKNGTGVAIGAATWGNGLGGTVGSVSAANSLLGSANYDTVGASITALSNGNYVVNSYGWNSKSGAVTWGNGAGGTVGAVSSLNSLVGTLGQNIGWGSGTASTDGVVALVGNGNYVVNSSSAGFVTWGNGLGGTVGNLSSANSLQGTAGSYSTKVYQLTNGNYVAVNPLWNPGVVAGAGAVTWGDGALGTVGVVSAANSLVGSIVNDNVGSGGITALTNGNYVVTSQNWANGAATGAGAATWGNGLGGTVGAVSSANSLVGSTANDLVGWNGFQSTVVALSNGNYVVGSKSWDNGAVVDAGAATWGDGSTAGARLIGTISAANSLVGSTASDLVGFSVTALKVNGNYVVSSGWANGAATGAGAATWGNGLGGTVGTISAVNSLVGTTASDGVGSKVEALANGNYVVLSSNWDNGAATNAGAATWGNGTAGITGTVSSANSLVGDTAGDQIGGWYFTALSNGNYVVNTPGWHSNTGHVALGDGTTGLSGVASSVNGAVGAVAGDYLGYDYAGAGSAGGTGNGIRALPNGGYVISSMAYNGGMATGFGRVTLEAVPRSSLPFALNQGLTTNINPLDIAVKLNAGANVVLQANNDITQNFGAAITATGAGSLTLQAGRSVFLQDSISIVGNLIVTANDPNAIPADRAAGIGYLDASGATLSAASMSFTNSAGDVMLGNITTTGTVTSAASGWTSFSGTNSMFMLDARTYGGAAGSGWVKIVGGSTTTTAASPANLLSINHLDMSGGTLNVGMNADIGSLLNWSGGSITVNGIFGTGATTNITGTVTLAGTASGFSTWNNPGTININGAGVLQLDGTNTLTLANYGAGVINLNGSAATPITFLNNANNVVISEYNGGVINKNIGSAASQTVNAALNFSGPVGQQTAAGGLNVNQGTLILGGASAGALSGTFNVAAGATLDLGNTQYTFANTSSLMGAGSIQASTNVAMNGALTTAGAIFPGSKSSVGTLSIVGNLVMNSGSGLFLNLNGVTAGQFDVLNVSGTTTLNTGTSLSVGGVGAAGTYTVINSGGALGGTFTTISAGTFTQGAHTYGANALTLNLTANAVAGYTYWDGGAGTMNWNDALNWSADLVPTAATGVYLDGIVGAIIAPSNVSVADLYQSNTTLNTSGNFTLQSANDINLNASTINGTGGAFTLLANNSIFMAGNSSIVGTYNLNVVLNSDADASGAGSIMLTGSSIISKGGNITLGGGLAGNGTGWARGTITSSLAGIYLSGARLDAGWSYGSGSIALNGRGYDSAGSNFADGVRITNASVITTDAYWDWGSITVNGVGGASSSNNNGVRIDAGSTLTTNTGDVNVKGSGGLAVGSSNMGVFISGAGTSIYSTSGIVSIDGTGGSVGAAGANNRGVRLDSSAAVSTLWSRINILGTGAYGGDGVQLYSSVSSTGGAINIYGLSGDAVTLAHGVIISGATTSVTTANDASISISGTSIASGGAGQTGGSNRGVRIEAGAKVDTSSISGGNTGSINILAQGGNRGDGFQLVTGSSLLTDSGGITVVAQSGINQSGSTQLVGAAISASTISSKGGNIFIDGTSNATFGSNNYGVMVTAASNISTQFTGNVTLIGQGGNGTDAATTLNNGVGVNGNSSVSVVDGLLSMFGTAGTVTGSTNRGVEIHGATTLVHATGAGSIYLNGVIPGSSAGGFDSGVVVGFGADVATTSGYINITGSGVNGGSNNYGVRVEDAGSTITSTTGAITLTGSGATTGTANYGVGVTTSATVDSTSGAIKLVSNNGDISMDATAVVASTSTGKLSLISQRDLLIANALSHNGSVMLRVDKNGTGVGALSFTGAGHLTVIPGNIVDVYYNPVVFGTQDSFAANITSLSAFTLNQWMLVNSAANLQAMGASPANLAGSYALGNNLNMTGVTGFVPIGSVATPFTGQFDGLNREISNPTINTPAVSQVGLFGVIGATGAVKNLGLTNVAINGDASVGALAGINYGSIYNTYVSGGTVTGGNGATGGLVGVNQGGNGTNAVGVTAGVAGSNASISNSYLEKVNVAVTAAANPAVGGMVGINRAGNGGNGGNGAIGAPGAVGGAGGSASVTNSYTTGGTVSGMGTDPAQYVGGLVGQNIGGNGGIGGAGGISSAGGNAGAGGMASLSNSYSSSGAVSANGNAFHAGGLIGNNVLGAVGTVGTGLVGGALGGSGAATATNLYWNMNSTGDISATGIGTNTGTITNVLGLNDQQMHTQSMLDAANPVTPGFFDFGTTWIQSGYQLPMLRSEWNAEINNVHQLQLMNANLGANYTLARNLDLASAYTVTPGSIWSWAHPISGLWNSDGFGGVGNSLTPFTGTFDSSGYIINALQGSALQGSAIFGQVGATGVINNLHLTNVASGGGVATLSYGLVINSSVANSTINRNTFAGALVNENFGYIVNSQVTNTSVQMAVPAADTGSQMGGLVGSNNGSIINSHVVGGSVTGQQFIGGLVGYNSTNALIANSYVTNNSVAVVFPGATASFNFGGIVGDNWGTISNSYVSGGSVTGNSDAAGFVGVNNGRILNSHISTGTITGTGVGGPLVAVDNGLLINSHYDINAVLVNGASRVMSGGLYATQFAEWKNTGTLNIANSASLAKVGNVYSISTTQGMKDMLGFAADARYSYQLAVTLDMSSVVDPTLANYGVPVLAGSFNGNGNTLNNLNINTPKVSDVGLFGHVLSYATIDTLLLGTPSVTGAWSVGALAGWNEGLIRNSGVMNGIVSAGSSVGGLVGLNDGFIIQSYVSGGSVSATAAAGSGNLGGLVGVNNGSIISNSYVSNGTLNGAANISKVGGLVGLNSGNVTNASVNGLAMNTMTLADNVGGLVGYNGAGASLTYSHVAGTANVIGRNNVGGLVGNNIRGISRGISRIGVVDNNYFSGTSVTGQNYVGGLVGLDGYFTGDGTFIGVTNNYVSSGAVSGTTFMGALVGNGLPQSATNNRYNVDAVTVNAQTVVTRGGLYSTQFNDWVLGANTLNIANYSGIGQSLEYNSISGKYIITSVQGMKDLIGFADGSIYSFALGANVDLTGLQNYSIPVLAGTFDGQGNTISGLNLSLAGFDQVGLFGHVLSTGAVRNLGLITPSVIGNNTVGGLVGFNEGIIDNAYATGAVSGLSWVGGLVGKNQGAISNSYTSAVLGGVNGASSVGGLVGYNLSGTINNAYSLVAVTGTGNDVGGLVGTNQSGSITNSYATGAVSGVSFVGGLVGTNAYFSSISDSYATGAVSGSDIGGLVGYNFSASTINNAYATGNVTGNGAGAVGGLVGANNGSTISNTYASGVVNGTALYFGGLVGVNQTGGIVGTSFFDSDTSGRSVAFGSDVNFQSATAVRSSTPTIDAFSQAAYTGFDFVNKWRIVEGLTRPGLISLVKTVTVTANNDAKTYDGIAYTTGVGVTYPTTASSSLIYGTPSYGGSAIGAVNAGSYAITPGGLYSSQYDLIFANGNLVVGKANATVTANSGTVTYTGLAQTVSGFTAVGLVNGEAATVLTGVTASGTGINAGTYLTIASGTDGNYNLTFVNGTLVINPATVVVSPLAIAANNASKTYGTTLTFAGTEFTPIGLLNGDTITGVTLTSTGAVNTANVGSYAINVTPGSEVFGQGLASNYTLTYTPGTLTVNPAALTVSAIVQTKIYGDADPALTYTSSGLLFSDTLTGSLGRVAGENVGNYTINQGSLDNPNYAITFTGNTLSVTPRSITIAATTTSKVYGDADPNLFTVGGSGLASWDTNGTVFTGSLAHTGGENVGTYIITQGSLLANANYNVAGFTGNNLLITPAVLTIVANSQSKMLGTPDPLLTYMTYGLKLNDSAATTLSGALDRDTGDTIGTYSINKGSLALLSSNYTMTYVAGTFRILAPTVVQEITQMTLQSAPPEDTAATSQEQEKKESAELLAEASIVDDSGQPLVDSLPVCR